MGEVLLAQISRRREVYAWEGLLRTCGKVQRARRGDCDRKLNSKVSRKRGLVCSSAAWMRIDKSAPMGTEGATAASSFRSFPANGDAEVISLRLKGETNACKSASESHSA